MWYVFMCQGAAPGANPLPADVIQVTLHSAERLGSDYLLGTPANLGCLSGALKQHIVLGMLGGGDVAMPLLTEHVPASVLRGQVLALVEQAA
jgi:hypothetical protein